MPNWCSNFLQVECLDNSKESKEELKKFKDGVTLIGETIPKKDINKRAKLFLKEKMESLAKEGKTNEYLELIKLDSIKLFKRFYIDSTILENGDLCLEHNVFTCNKLLPCPEELHGEDLHSYGGENSEDYDTKRARMIQKYGFSNAIDWQIENWGSKWDACEPYLSDESETKISYFFETAWSPLEPFVKEMCKQFPNLRFTLDYEEPGCDFKGTLICEGGEIVGDECGTCPPTCSCCGEEVDSEDDLDEDNGECEECIEANAE